MNLSIYFKSAHHVLNKYNPMMRSDKNLGF